MRRILATIGAALAIGVLGGVLVGGSISGPENRMITASTNWVPLQNPAGGPYFGKLDADARSY